MVDVLGRRPDITETKDLSQAEKEALSLVWQELVLGKEGQAADLSAKNLEEVRDWLHHSLMEESGKIAAEWGMKVDLEMLRDEKLGTLSERQLRFIEAVKARFNLQTQQFTPATEKSSKYDSWPAMMRQNKQFNCVGGSMLGASFLEQAGIKFWQGSAVGHAINIAQLEDGRWMYVDFLNGLVKEIQPKIRNIGGQTVLEVDDGAVWYRNIHLLPANATGAYVLGNFAALINEVQDPFVPETREEEVDLAVAQEYFKKNRSLLLKSKPHELRRKLYPELVQVEDADEIETERHVKDATKKMDTLISREYNRLIRSEGSDELLTEEVLERNPDILDWLGHFEDQFPSKISPLLEKFLRIVQEGLRDIKKDQPEAVFAEVLDSMAKRFAQIKSRR